MTKRELRRLKKGIDLISLLQKKIIENHSVSPVLRYRNSFYHLFYDNNRIEELFLFLIPVERLDVIVSFLSTIQSASGYMDNTLTSANGRGSITYEDLISCLEEFQGYLQSALNTYGLNVFYSWQSELSSPTNRSFIEDALEKAIKSTAQEAILPLKLDKDTAGRAGSPDMSLIFQPCKCQKMSQPQCHYIKYFVTIKAKMNVEDSLDSDKIFVFWQLSGCAVSMCHKSKHSSVIITPDIIQTILEKIDNCFIFVADVSLIPSGSHRKKAPNANVLFELGYAYGVHSDESVIMVFNTDTGNIEDLPFDIRAKRIIAYHCTENMEPEIKKQEKARLKERLKYAIEQRIKAEIR